MNNIDTFCFSGGAAKGFSFISALHILIKHNYINLNNIKIYVGTSAGSVIAFLLSINYTPHELITSLTNMDLSKIGSIFNLELFLEKYGLTDGSEFMEIIEILFFNKMKMKNITFNDLYIITKNKLLIVGTNFTKGIEEVFSVDTSPNMLVLDAIRISISIPLLFTPIKYNDCYYIDGCVVSNLPFHLCNPQTTLCFHFNKLKYFKLESQIDLINGVISIITNNKLNLIDNYRKLIIYHNNCDIQTNCNKNNLTELFNIGYKSGKKFLIKEYKQKIDLLTTNIVKNVLDSILIKIDI